MPSSIKGNHFLRISKMPKEASAKRTIFSSAGLFTQLERHRAIILMPVSNLKDSFSFSCRILFYTSMLIGL